MKVARAGIIVSALPSLLMLGLFYSLAIHMRRSFGAWPASIGERGFPPSLVTHAGVTVDLFVALLLSSTFVAPVAIVVCLVVERWRHCAAYLTVYALLFFVC